jgi:hypothetical protein
VQKSEEAGQHIFVFITHHICAIFLMKFLQNIASYCTFYLGPLFLMKYFHPLHHIEQISDEMFASHLQITPCSLTTPSPPLPISSIAKRMYMLPLYNF